MREGASSKVKEISLREVGICEISTSSVFQNSLFSAGGVKMLSVIFSLSLSLSKSVLKGGLFCAGFCARGEVRWQEKIGNAKKQSDKK